ncbi:bifunctional ADP-dependent NAD(P)H-hydrate dehydratase/NAD(P)H-hydrate epimerase [Leminorella grimontii]|uniref:bifunctional ADP-dependent NAD(P)H-hydrate dehydratase/NAD(P)H-hydrate epimerase n=1 Tax=Leminorella grimontii TaxID=82981 RepID=UPI000410D36A|nr:bifunctional ADP-dependent NAD(P)H-hydrate dehydratase/NAD(P)H-hydrate epimerase [Leminorella grimontii]
MTDHQQKRHGMSLPHSVFSAEWVRENEKVGARYHGLSLYQLMENAGEAAFGLCRRLYPDARRWLVLCGHGNNGGDAYVVARFARQYGMEVTVIGGGPEQRLPDEAKRAREHWVNNYGQVLSYDAAWPSQCDLIVDGLLGNGVQGEPKEPYASLIRAANASAAPIVSLDIPSGLNADTGDAAGDTICARHTLTFVALKSGLLTGRARDFVGELHYASLGISGWLSQQKPQIERLTAESIARWLTPRRPCSHKGEHGRLLVVGGDAGMGGAVRMAGEAALRTGAGLVKVLTRRQHVAPILSARPELMAQALDEKSLIEGLTWANVVAVGPGLGQSPWAQEALERISADDKIAVWDADALNLLAINPNVQARRVITPHPGEAARLLQCNVESVERDRIKAACRLAERFGGVAVLKGAGTVIADGEGRVAIADVGNAGMASGGMGDLLTGIIASLLGQGLTPFDAACAGAVIHGAAGDGIARKQGQRGTIATDLLSEIPKLVNPL